MSQVIRPNAAQAGTLPRQARRRAGAKELGELHQSGVLDDAEFAQAKAKILARG